MLDDASPVLTVLIIGSISFGVTLLGVPAMRRLALHSGVVDNPEQGKMHTGATPYFGGLAIGLAALLIPSLFQDWTREAAFIGVAAIMVSVCGLVDDLRNLHPFPRLGVEVLASALAVHAGARIHLFDNWLDVALTILWLVVITNSFNLLDNMDGVAGMIATATSVSLVVAAVMNGQVLVGALAAAVAGGCVGFLVYNWHPATIFMGDAGSLLLGFLIAVVSLKLRWSTPQFNSITAVILIMAPAVFDTALVVTSRKLAGRSIMVGGTDHTSHRLHQLGLPIRSVAALFGVIAIVFSALGVLVGRGAIDPIAVISPVLFVAGVAFVSLLRMPVYASGAGRSSPLGGDRRCDPDTRAS